jgi:hypothetical protein
MSNKTLKVYGAFFVLSIISIAIGTTVGTFAALMHVGSESAKYENLRFVYSLCGTLGAFGTGLYTIYTEC